MQEMQQDAEVEAPRIAPRFRIEAVRKKKWAFILLYVIRLDDMKTFVKKCVRSEIITISQRGLKNLGFSGLITEKDINWRTAFDGATPPAPPQQVNDITV